MDEDEGKGVSITDQPGLMLTLVCPLSPPRRKNGKRQGGVDNKVWEKQAL